MLTIKLSWPDPSLWPNSRRHWSDRARATREARLEGRVVTQAALYATGFDQVKWSGTVRLSIAGHKPNTRRRDLQNLQSALKGAVDGIADALHVDDEHFELTTCWGAVDSPRGSVTIEIGNEP